MGATPPFLLVGGGVFMSIVAIQKSEILVNPSLPVTQVLFIEFWSDGSRLVIHSGLNEACDSATNYIMTLNWVSTYTAFTNQPDSDCPIQFVLSDSLKVLILRVCMGKPIVLPL